MSNSVDPWTKKNGICAFVLIYDDLIHAKYNHNLIIHSVFVWKTT